MSHETIYRSLFVQARGVLKKDGRFSIFDRSVRSDARKRRAGKALAGVKSRTMVSIRERPASVEDRAVPGHWEGDLLSGSKNSYIATLVERQTRYVMLVKVANKETLTVVSALIRQARKLPTELYKSLTCRLTGARNSRTIAGSAWRPTSMSTSVIRKAPWQRGSNENTNGLLRQYFPKGTDVSVYSQAHLNKVARQLNERPRKTSRGLKHRQRDSTLVPGIDRLRRHCLMTDSCAPRRPARRCRYLGASRVLSLPFIPSIAETLEFCIITGYSFGHA